MLTGARVVSRIASIALLCGMPVCGGALAADGATPPSRYATLNCDQLRLEYFRLDRGLLQDKSGARMPGADDKSAVRGASSEAERSNAMSDALSGMELLSRMYVAKRCDPHDAEKSRARVSASEIYMFAQLADISMGRNDYKNRCAMCHGADGKGGGWFAQYLTVKPPLLSQMKKGGNGVFPMARLYDMIDGRQDVAIHGSREMPVWGANYRNQASRAVESFAGEASHPESNVRARIYGLLKYLYQFQE